MPTVPIMAVDAATLRLNAVIELSSQIARERDAVSLLDQFCSGILGVAAARCVAAGILGADGTLNHLAVTGADPAQCATAKAQLQAFLVSLIEEHRQGKLTDAELRGRAMEPPFRISPSASFLIMPLTSGRRTHGWLYVFGKAGGNGYSAEDERLIAMLAAQLTGAYDKLIALEEVERANELLRKSEAKYRDSIQNASCGICRTDRVGRLLIGNPALVEMCGFETEQELLECGDLPFEQVVRTHGSANNIDGVEIVWPRTILDTMVFRISGRSTTGEAGVDGFDLIVEDITERKHLEQQFRQSQKMEAAGRLVGAIAHDFNNLLTIILGYAAIMLEEYPPGSHFHRNFSEVKKAGERAATLSRQLLAFSKKAAIRPMLLDLNAVISAMQRMLHRFIGEDIALEIIPGSNLKPIKADPGQIEQILLNLSINARDAMPRGGTLVIRTANEAGRVKLEIRDSGCGMPPEVLSRIFEPFFTTKEWCTGLGLSTVYGIVQQNGGEIEVDSEAGEGTTFRVYLPQARTQEPGSAQTLPPLAAGETILLVEDEQTVRDLTALILKKQGYNVIAASSGEEALQISDGFRTPIHLLLTDVVMPHMSGSELRDQLTMKRPDIKVLFMSGYLDDAVVRHGVSENEAAFIQKPFLREALVRKVREVLGATEASCR